MESIKISHQELSDILLDAKLIKYRKYGVLRIFWIKHLITGCALAIEPCNDGVLLIWGDSEAMEIDIGQAVEWLEGFLKKIKHINVKAVSDNNLWKVSHFGF